MNLQKKRADLVAQVEQYVGQINRTNGAIALIDDLLVEQQQERQELPNTLPPAASEAPGWVQQDVKEMPQVQSADVVQS